ncbi:DUF2742 domain-containing protein [uncultured Mycobacterium sp.]|uniref:DUF2742 domain-containing protein n=1 Tax=uncultured Mycobacterium sp. TaxID=171292 RepID=UPI0035CBDBB5
MTEYENGPPIEDRPPENRKPTESFSGHPTTPTSTKVTAVGSRQVSWWRVHEHVTSLLERVGSWPQAGTPEWCDLDDTDPRKAAALFDAAQHHALRVEIAQEARSETSRDIAAAVDWPAIASQIRQRREAYIPREVAP